MSLAATHPGFRIWPLFVPVVALVGLAVLWLSIVYGLRLKELHYRLRTNTDRQHSVRTLSLVSRFGLLLQKSARADETRSYSREGRLMQALGHTVSGHDVESLGIAEQAGLWTIELFNKLAGSPRFKYERESPWFVMIEKAYSSELRRDYPEAIALYNQLLENSESLSSDWQAYARLHRGFCLALSEKRRTARDDFAYVISSYKGEYEITARALLKIIDEVEKRMSSVDLMPRSATKGRAYYELTAYDKAIQTLRGLDDIHRNPSALYYLGKSHEESGNNSAAAGFYRRIIVNFRKTDWAKKANRRLYAMGVFYSAGGEYRNESKSNIEKKVVSDTRMLQDIRHFEKVADHAASLGGSPSLLVDGVPEAPNVSVESARGNSVASATRSQPAGKVRTVTAAPGSNSTPMTALDTARTWAEKEALSRKDKAEYLRRQRSLMRFALADGNQFSGVIIKETTQTVLLFTVIGKVSIDKGQVLNREKIIQ